MVPKTEERYTLPKPEPDLLRNSGHAYCPVCEKPVDLLGLRAAAKLFHTDRDDIQALAECHKLHRVHNKAGKVMICSLSLFECFESRETRPLDARVLGRIQ